MRLQETQHGVLNEFAEMSRKKIEVKTFPSALVLRDSWCVFAEE